MTIRPFLLSAALLAAILPPGANAFTSFGEFKAGTPLTLDIPISDKDTCGVVIENVTPADPSNKMTVTVRSLAATQIIDVDLRVTFGNGMFTDQVSGSSILNSNRVLMGSKVYDNTRWPLKQYSVNVVLTKCVKKVPDLPFN